MFAVCTIALFCLLSVSRAAPLDCDDLTEPLGQVDLRDLEGRWTLVAVSLKILKSAVPLKLSDSVTVDFYNSTYTQGNRYGDSCHYMSSNVSIEWPDFNFSIGQVFNVTGTLYRTSCPDCLMLSINLDSPTYKTMELCLFSRRREVEQKELEEFKAQVECLNLLPPVMMDPTKELCPEKISTEEQREA